ncbi:MAG: hypothetical protein QOG82_493 [Actinomycetota bacterium]|nr:hypothetical protein [Actinomycetota bacterium]
MTEAAARRVVEVIGSVRPAVIQLAELLAAAVRIEPALVRRLRLEILRHVDASVEADLWFSPLVQAHSPSGISLSVSAAVVLRERLRDRWETGSDEDRSDLSRARDIYQEVHAHLPPALVLEEQVAWDLVVGDTAQLEARLDAAIGAFVKDPEGARFWLGQAAARLPDVTATAANGQRVRDAAAQEGPLGPVWEAAYRTIGTRPMAVRHLGGMVQFEGQTGPGTRRIDVPDSQAVVLEVTRDPDRPPATIVVGDDPVLVPATGTIDVRTASGVSFLVRGDPFLRPVALSTQPGDVDPVVFDLWPSVRRILEQPRVWLPGEPPRSASVKRARVAEPGEMADFAVQLVNDKVVISGLAPDSPAIGPMDVRTTTDTARLAEAIDHVSLWLTAGELLTEGPSDLADAVETSVSWLQPSGPSGPTVPADLDWLWIDVRNRTDRPLHVGALVRWPDWSVSAVTSASSLEAGAETTLSASAQPDLVGTANVIVVAAEDPFDLGPLVQGPLGSHRRTRSVESRSGGLDGIIAWMTGTVDALAEPYDRWVTSETWVEIVAADTALADTIGALPGRHLFLAIAADDPSGALPMFWIRPSVTMLAEHLAERGFEHVLPDLAGSATLTDVALAMDALLALAADGGGAESIFVFVAGAGRREQLGGADVVLTDGSLFELDQLARFDDVARNVTIVVDVAHVEPARFLIGVPDLGTRPRSMAILGAGQLAESARGELLVPALVEELRSSHQVDHDLAVRVSDRLGLDFDQRVDDLVVSQPPRLPPVRGSLRIEILPAQHGQSVFVEAATGERPWRMLFDGGPRGARAAVDLVDSLPPADRRLDLVVVSHVEESAVGGILDLLELPDVEIGAVWFNPPATDAPPRQDARRLVEVIEARNLPWNDGGRPLVTEGDRPTIFEFPGILITLLAPDDEDLWERQGAGSRSEVAARAGDPEPEPDPRPDEWDQRATDIVDVDVEALAMRPTPEDRGGENQRSIALLLNFEGLTCLLPGDLTPNVLEQAVRREARRRGESRLRVDAVVAPHRGSRRSVTRSLVAAVASPNWLFTPDGSKFRHPDPEAVARVLTGTRLQTTLHFAYRSQQTERWDSPVLKERYRYETRYPRGGDAGISLVLSERRPPPS